MSHHATRSGPASTKFVWILNSLASRLLEKISNLKIKICSVNNSISPTSLPRLKAFGLFAILKLFAPDGNRLKALSWRLPANNWTLWSVSFASDTLDSNDYNCRRISRKIAGQCYYPGWTLPIKVNRIFQTYHSLVGHNSAVHTLYDIEWWHTMWRWAISGRPNEAHLMEPFQIHQTESGKSKRESNNQQITTKKFSLFKI